MKTKILSTLIFVLILLLSSGCGSANTPPPADNGSAAVQPLWNRDAASSYAAEFRMAFSGSSAWSYELRIRKTPSLKEMSLHMDGVPAAQNPGDIRLVTDGTDTWMIGPGTEQECIQFPNQRGMDPTFLYPESLVPPQALSAILTNIGDEVIDGLTIQHFQSSGKTAGGWRDAKIDVWQDKASTMLYQFSMQASGEDPFFGAGSGNLTADYKAGGLLDENIPPVDGCESIIPLPDDAAMYVRLPGMISFESQYSADALVSFYQSILPQEGWVEKEPASQAEGATVLSYQRDPDQVEVHIEAAQGGSLLKVLFMQNQ